MSAQPGNLVPPPPTTTVNNNGSNMKGNVCRMYKVQYCTCKAASRARGPRRVGSIMFSQRRERTGFGNQAPFLPSLTHSLTHSPPLAEYEGRAGQPALAWHRAAWPWHVMARQCKARQSKARQLMSSQDMARQGQGRAHTTHTPHRPCRAVSHRVRAQFPLAVTQPTTGSKTASPCVPCYLLPYSSVAQGRIPLAPWRSHSQGSALRARPSVLLFPSCSRPAGMTEQDNPHRNHTGTAAQKQHSNNNKRNKTSR